MAKKAQFVITQA